MSARRCEGEELTRLARLARRMVVSYRDGESLCEEQNSNFTERKWGKMREVQVLGSWEGSD